MTRAPRSVSSPRLTACGEITDERVAGAAQQVEPRDRGEQPDRVGMLGRLEQRIGRPTAR